MRELYNRVPYMDDEMLLSLVIRTAKANSLPNVSSLITNFLQPEKAGHYQNPFLDASDIVRDFADSTCETDPVYFYLKHSLYSGTAPFLTRAKQTKTVNLAFRGRNKYPRLLTKQNSSIREILYCQDCMKEDGERDGFVWIHRSHHMPGVKVCPIHGTVLSAMKGSVKDIFAEDYHLETLGYDPDDVDMEYARFSKDFLDADIETDASGLLTAIYARMNELKISRADLDSVAEDRGKSTLFTVQPSKFFAPWTPASSYVNVQNAMALLILLFGDVKTLQRYIVSDTDNSLRFIERIDENKYELYEPYRENIVQMRHVSCGNSFITTPYGFANGWRCPCCDVKPEEEKAAEIIRLTGDGEYEPLALFEGMDKKLLMRHSCGRKLTIKPRAFLEEGVRCECENNITIEQARDFVLEHGSGDYELIEYSGTEKPVVIRHNVCGGEFHLDRFRTFKKHQRCPLCNPRNGTRESFEKDIRDLVGDEYSLISTYTNKTTPVIIHHNVCGHEQKMTPLQFERGMRCSHCWRQVRRDRLEYTVKEISLGRYEVTDRPTRNLYLVHDNETDKDIRLTLAQIMQELNRPTPSPVLPLEKKGVVHPRAKDPKSNNELLAVVEQHADENGLVFLQDFADSELEDWRVDKMFADLLEARTVRKIAPGIYSTKEREYSTRELIEAKYICRNGRHIGFYGYEDLAYEFGIIENKPEKLHLVTNMEASTSTGRQIKAFGVPIRIYGPPMPVTNNNYRQLEVLHLIAARHHYGWNYQDKLREYLSESGFNEKEFLSYLPLYPERVAKQLHELYEAME